MRFREQRTGLGKATEDANMPDQIQWYIRGSLETFPSLQCHLAVIKKVSLGWGKLSVRIVRCLTCN